jgi:RNA polymerase sigma-70 factor (ECF subfamily)
VKPPTCEVRNRSLGEIAPETLGQDGTRNADLVRKRSEASIEEEPQAMDVAADSPNPLAARELSEDLKRLMDCVGLLEADRKEMVLLAYYNGASREQLAAKFDKPVNTIKTWLRRSLIEIRECLGS